jgi:hypothetical protein
MSNPYAPPRDSGEEEERAIQARQRSAQFYRVAPSTLAALQLVTLGLYAVYWFYRHWAVQKRARRLNISPLARGIFAIFFVHRLFRVIDQGARAVGISPRWKPGSQATLFVLLVLAGRTLGNLGSDGQVIVVSLVINALSILPLVAAQRLANRANGQTLLEPEAGDEDEDEDDAREAS